MISNLKDDMLHILVNLYLYQYKCKNLVTPTMTDFELRYEIIALNAMAKNIAMSVARMFDKSNSTRSIIKIDKYKNDKQFRKKIDDFVENTGKELIIKRNTELAHMNKKKRTSYPIDQIPSYVVESISFLVNTLDELEGTEIQYLFRSGSTRNPVDFRKEFLKE